MKNIIVAENRLLLKTKHSAYAFGVNADFVYTLTVYGRNPQALPSLPAVCGGRGLMEIGVSAPLVGDFDSRILHYKRKV